MLKISFNFNETTKTVSNVSVIDVSTGKARGVISNSTPVEPEGLPDVQVLENKLQLSKTAMSKLGVKADDRVSVQYINEGIGKSSPIIGKAEAFTDRLDGNRVASKGTVSFRGEKRATLVQFGTEFELEQYKDNIWKLVPYAEDKETLSEEQSDMDALNDTEINKEIEELISSEDDLPF